MYVLVISLFSLIAVNASNDLDLWTNFKNEYGKSYKNVMEERQRFQIFKQNLREIEAHNVLFKNKESTYTKGISQFSDLTSFEFSNLFGKQTSLPKMPGTRMVYSKVNSNNIPDQFDWRQRDGVVSDLRTQYYCSANWAMSAVGSIESQVFLKTGRRIRLSEQELLECSSENRGCNSGTSYRAFDYIISHGLALEKDYPFKRQTETCKNTTIPKSAIKVTGYTDIPRNSEEVLKQTLVSVGPISAMFFSTFVRNYKSGIVNERLCPNSIWDNTGLIVGYGRENNTDFWIVQSYFGPQWGENGYFRILRNANMCGIANRAMYPVIV